MIHGIASTPTVNSHGDSLKSDGCQICLPVPLKSEHGTGRVGEIVYVRRSRQSLYVRAIMDEGSAAADYAWNLILNGETRCFSAAAAATGEATSVDGKKFYSKWTLGEVSVCRNAANSDCYFEIFRPGDSFETLGQHPSREKDVQLESDTTFHGGTAVEWRRHCLEIEEQHGRGDQPVAMALRKSLSE